jgi:argininosuccinate lyase
MKALPLAYAKDLQEDKEQSFMLAETLDLCLSALTAMVIDMTPNASAMRDAATLGFSTATDLADWLVRELSVPFRDAHHMTGQIIKLAEEKKVMLDGLSLRDMQKIEPRIHQGVYDVLSVEASMKSRTSYGGTAPSVVSAAIVAAKKTYLE